MKFLKTLFLICAIGQSVAFAQDVAVDELPTAHLDANFYLTLDPTVPVSDFYKVDISHLEFENEADAIQKCRAYLTGNLISNEVHFSENYLIVHIHTEYLHGDLNYDKIQTYLGQLKKG